MPTELSLCIAKNIHYIAAICSCFSLPVIYSNILKDRDLIFSYSICPLGKGLWKADVGLCY